MVSGTRSDAMAWSQYWGTYCLSYKCVNTTAARYSATIPWLSLRSTQSCAWRRWEPLGSLPSVRGKPVCLSSDVGRRTATDATSPRQSRRPAAASLHQRYEKIILVLRIVTKISLPTVSAVIMITMLLMMMINSYHSSHFTSSEVASFHLKWVYSHWLQPRPTESLCSARQLAVAVTVNSAPSSDVTGQVAIRSDKVRWDELQEHSNSDHNRHARDQFTFSSTVPR